MGMSSRQCQQVRSVEICSPAMRALHRLGFLGKTSLARGSALSRPAANRSGLEAEGEGHPCGVGGAGGSSLLAGARSSPLGLESTEGVPRAQVRFQGARPVPPGLIRSSRLMCSAAEQRLPGADFTRLHRAARIRKGLFGDRAPSLCGSSGNAGSREKP